MRKSILVSAFVLGVSAGASSAPVDGSTARHQFYLTVPSSAASATGVRLVPGLMDYGLLEGVQGWFRSASFIGGARQPLLPALFFDFTSTTPAGKMGLVPSPVVSKASDAADSSYKWLLRSQRRSILRDEKDRPVESTLSRPARARARGSNVTTEITLTTSRQESAHSVESSGLPAGATSVRVAFPISERSITTLEGRIAGESGTMAWAARGNLSFHELVGHAMEAGVMLGSRVFGTGLLTRDVIAGRTDSRSDWIAGAYARDEWELQESCSLSYGLTYERTNFPVSAGFFGPRVALRASLPAGFRLVNEVAYGVNVPGKSWSQPYFSDSYAYSVDRTLSPERFLAYRTKVTRQISARHNVEVDYLVERVQTPILRVPGQWISPGPDTPTGYVYLVANTTDMRAESIGVNYRAQLSRNLEAGILYRMGRSTLTAQPANRGDFRDLMALAEGDLHTLCLDMTVRFPSTSSTISGLCRWDNRLPLRAESLGDWPDDPTTQIDINLRQGIPIISGDAMCWEFLLDIRNPVTFGQGVIPITVVDDQAVRIVPHPRRITGGLSFKF